MAGSDPMVDIPFDVLWHEHGTRADVFLSRRVKRMSRSLAARVIRAGSVRREPGGVLLDKPSTLVFEGERLVLKRKRLDEASTDDLAIPIVHEDSRLLVVNKPGNLVVHPTASAYNRTLIRIMRARLRDDGLDLAHRIDKETSGLVVMARDFDGASALTRQFARRTVQKLYLAIVDGVPAEDRFTVRLPMRLVPDSKTSCLMEIGGKGAMPAETDFTVLARGPDVAAVAAQPKTGRQHQIRVHLMFAGHPILGDKLYRGDEDFFIEAVNGALAADTIVERVGHVRQALHCWQMTLDHPDGRPITLKAPPPPDLLALGAARGLRLPGAEAAKGAEDEAPERSTREHDLPAAG